MSGINSVGQVAVTSGGQTIIAGNGNRAAVLITNTSSTVTVFLGEAPTAATGHALLPLSTISLPVQSPVLGITASGSATVTFLEVL